MSRRIVSLLAVALLLLGVTGCKKAINIEQLEKELVGVWWDAFQYSDVTEEGVPFSNVWLAIMVKADHTGCIYLGVFDDVHREPLAVYGGPEDAGFKWQLLEDGSVKLSDPASGESTVITKADSGSGSNYGNDMTNVSGTNMTYTGGSVTVTNGTYSGTLTKADSGKEGDIKEQFTALFSAVATNLSSGDNIKIKDIPGNTWGR